MSDSGRELINQKILVSFFEEVWVRGCWEAILIWGEENPAVSSNQDGQARRRHPNHRRDPGCLSLGFPEAGSLTRWCWEKLKAGGEEDDSGWDGWTALPTQWTWVWVNSGSWWWRGRPGVLQSMVSQRVGHDWVTELNTEREGLESPPMLVAAPLCLLCVYSSETFWWKAVAGSLFSPVHSSEGLWQEGPHSYAP